LIRKLFLLAPLALLMAASGARASITFSYAGVVQGTVAPNSAVTVNLYLKEVDTNGSSSLIAAEGGLYAGAVAIAGPSNGGGTTIASTALNSVTEPTGFTGNNNTRIYNNGVLTSANSPAGTNTASTTQQSNQMIIIGITNNSATVPPGPSGTTPGGSVTTSGTTTTTLVFLGSVVINVGSTANATYTVTPLKTAPAGLLDAGSYGNTIFPDGTDADHTNDSGFTFTGAASSTPGTFTIATTTATPEPSSMLLCGLAAGGMGFGAWRRRKAKLAAEAEAVAV
jgi:hypothetical protein